MGRQISDEVFTGASSISEPDVTPADGLWLVTASVSHLEAPAGRGSITLDHPYSILPAEHAYRFDRFNFAELGVVALGSSPVSLEVSYPGASTISVSVRCVAMGPSSSGGG